MRYTGRHTQAISFPLGGIGTGSVGLSGSGHLIDWEIRNRPNKCSNNGFSFFAVKAEKGGELLDVRALNGDLPAPYQGLPEINAFGYGPQRCTLAGAPHFRRCAFEGTYPFARIEFNDDDFPGRAFLHAFNPMIPSNADDSGIPAAFFSVEITNDTEETLDYYIAACLQNAFKAGHNEGIHADGLSLINLTGNGMGADDPAYGELCLATDAKDTAIQEYWFRGMWFDSLSVFWQNFMDAGHLRERTYAEAGKDFDVGAISAHLRLQSGQTGRVRFLISWYFPNFTNYWKPLEQESETLKNTWKNYYATRFCSASDAAEYALKNWDRLEKETRLFSDALEKTTIPEYCIDAITATMSVLKTATCVRLTDGSFYGWEGLNARSGSCEGSCTHVWNYAYALPFLYPSLERTLRETNYAYNQDEAGGMHFRTQLPLGRPFSDFRPCADGQFGDVMKVYREWKVCGDTAWLKRLWPKVKKSVEYAWSPQNPDAWDVNRDGVLEGRQHHTLDMELFGPSSWLNGFYLGALKAASAMAEAVGDTDAAREFKKIYRSGRAWVDQNLFNGKYYIHKADLDDREQLKRFGDAYVTYWNDEAKEVKYQIGEGSSIDQLTAQWHANNMGLGDLLDPAQVKRALRFIYENNFISMRGHFNPCRLYSLNDEKGTVMCVWPKGARKPVIPVPYAQETMYGFEYQAAASMLQNGLIDEGLELVKAIRARHNGENRNPWNEMECGSNYARSMASYSILLSLSGFEYDMTCGHIGFMPRINENDFKTFWALDGAWGVYEQNESAARLKLLYGAIKLQSVKAGGRAYAHAQAAGNELCLTEKDGCCAFDKPVFLRAGEEIIFSM